MRQASSALISFLLSKQPCWLADLFTITLLDGTVLRWTSADQPITFGLHTWAAQGPMLQRSKWNMVNTIQVPELNINMMAGNDSTFNVGSLNIKQYMHNGGFDGARLQLERAVMPVASGFGNTTLGTVVIFNGRVSQTKINAVGAEITVKGDNVLFNQYLPRNVYQTSCLHTLYDVGCTINAASFTSSGAVDTGSTARVVLWATPPANISKYQLGYIRFTSGAAAGSVRTIRAISGSNGLVLPYPLYAAPSAGDTFQATFGCDKTQATCSGTFSNSQHYRGFPYVPSATLAF